MPDYKECPYCAEQILFNDMECEHCKSKLDEVQRDSVLSEESFIPQKPEEQPTKGSPPPSPPPLSPKKIVPPPAPPQAGPAISPPPPPANVSDGGLPLPPLQVTGSTPPPPPPAAEAATVPAASKARETGANSFNNLIKAVSNLFGEGEFSASRLAQVERSSSIAIVVAAGLLGPLLSMLVALVNSSGAGGVFGRLFVNIFIASSLSNLFSLAVLFGLLYIWFEIRKEENSINAHLALTALVAVILFGAGLLALIARIIPWYNMGYVLVALVVYRYSNETYQRKAILDPLAVLAAWLLINSVIINRLIGFIF